MKQVSGLRAALRLVFRRARGLTAGLLLMIAANIVFGLLPPLALGKIVDSLTQTGTVSLPLAAGYFGFLALSGLCGAGQAWLITLFGQKITHGLRSVLLEKLRRLPASFYSGQKPGAVASLFLADVDTVEVLFDDGVVGMAVDAGSLLGILAVVFTKSPGLGLLLLLTLPPLYLFTRRIQKQMLRAQMDNRAAVARVSQLVPETLRCLRMIQNFGREAYLEARCDAAVQESYRSIEKTNRCDALYSPAVVLTGTAVTAVMMVLASMGGGVRALFGMSVGTAVSMIAYVGKVFAPLERIGMEIETVQSAAAGLRRVDEFLRREERTMPDLPAPAPAEPAAALRHVTFGYEADAPVLEDVSLTAARGESVTLTGRTGIGKSTVMRLLLGLYAPQKGSVEIFGAEASRIRDEEKRRLFGYVEQTFRPVPGTVGEQISLGDPAVGAEAVAAAARLAGLEQEILALPQGFDTPYSEELLSQGQRQLLGIARAVVSDPPILLLDETTANLDSGTEARVLEALRLASANRTVISVSHRRSAQTGREIACGAPASVVK